MDTNKPSLGGAVAIVVGPEPKHETVLVLDEKRRNPEWKFPGGGTELSDTFIIDPVTKKKISITDKRVIAIQTAIRELEEETGLEPMKRNGQICAHHIGVLYRSDKKGYTHYICVEVDTFATLKERGNEGELVKKCTFEEIHDGRVQILKYHKDFIDPLRKQLMHSCNQLVNS